MRRHISTLFLVTVGLALLLASCNGDDDATDDTGIAVDDTTEERSDPTPIPDPEPTPTSEPTSVPEPTPMPEPTTTPEPSPTPEPTPSPTPEPTPTPEPAFDPISISGHGQTLTDDFALPPGLTIAIMTHDGSSNFIVAAYDAETGEREGGFANEIGPYDGRSIFPTGDGGRFALDIMADGNWTIELTQPRIGDDEPLTPPFTIEGTGHHVEFFIELSAGLHRVSGTHSGESKFIVTAFDSDGQRLRGIFNEIGEFDGSSGLTVREGDSNFIVLSIHADGHWMIQIE